MEKELIEKKNDFITRADEVLNKAKEEKRELTDAEAQEATPVSACGTTLSVASTVTSTAAFTVSNFMNLIRKKELYGTMIFVNAFEHTVIKY